MDNGLTWGTAGNISVKLDDGHVLITASGSRFDSLTEDSLTLYEVSTQKYWGGKPSKELPVHLAVYRAVPWAGAVVHASPLHATLFSISGEPIPNNLFVENMYYLQRVCRIPYCHPGSSQLAEAVFQKAPSSSVMLLNNHGVLTYDSSLPEAAMALEILESTCRLALLAKGAGMKLNALDEYTVEDFLLRSGYKPPRVFSGTE
jgi:L-fuculose-phosphate aldolase